MSKQRLITEEREHNKLILTLGQARLHRLANSINLVRTRLINIFSMNLVVLGVIVSIYFTTWVDSDFKYLLIAPIGLSIISILICLIGLKKEVSSWNIISSDKEYFKKYQQMSERELHEDFLKNLQKGLNENSTTYKKIGRFYELGISFFISSVILFIIIALIYSYDKFVR